MLPEAQHRPPGLLKVCGGLAVALDVAGDLVRPVLGVCGRLGVVVGASVPVAAVDEHGDAGLAQDQIGGAGKLRLGPRGHPEPDASLMHGGAHRYLGLGVAAAVALHRLAGRWRRSP